MRPAPWIATPYDKGSIQRMQIRFPRQRRVDRGEIYGSIQQQPWHLAASRQVELRPCPEQLVACPLQVIQETSLHNGKKSLRCFRGTCVMLGMSSFERSTRTDNRIRSDLGSVFQERGSGRDSSSGTGPASRTHQPSRSVFIGIHNRLPMVPGTSIRIDVRVGGPCKRAVHTPAVCCSGGSIDR